MYPELPRTERVLDDLARRAVLATCARRRPPHVAPGDGCPVRGTTLRRPLASVREQVSK